MNNSGTLVCPKTDQAHTQSANSYREKNIYTVREVWVEILVAYWVKATLASVKVPRVRA
jgi:hypothetical protein